MEYLSVSELIDFYYYSKHILTRKWIQQHQHQQVTLQPAENAEAEIEAAEASEEAAEEAIEAAEVAEVAEVAVQAAVTVAKARATNGCLLPSWVDLSR